MRYEASSYEFMKEDLENVAAWFIDELHGGRSADYISTPWTAEQVEHGMCYAADKLSLPRSRGVIWRNYKHVRWIITPKVVESEEEVKEREVKFGETLQRLITEFGPWWEKAKEELRDIHRPFQELDLDKLSDSELAKKIEELRVLAYRMCEIHFEGLYGAWELFLLFRKFYQDIGMDASGGDFTNLIKGYDNDSYRQDRELYYLARKAVDFGIASLFELPADKVMPELKKEPKASLWIDDFNEWTRKWGWKIERCWWLGTPSWMEDPKFAIEKIKEYMKLTGLPRVAEVEKGEVGRWKTAERVRLQIPEDKRDTFNSLLKAAAYADIYSEEHNVYCEWLNHSIERRIILEASRRLVKAGTINDVNDIFLLCLDEIKKTLYWPERYRFQSLVEERRSRGLSVLKEPIPPVFSNKLTTEEAFGYMMGCGDPVLIYTVVGELPQPKPELKADIMGVGGAPGIAEGPARVVLDEDHLNEIQPGDILVCPTTSITWTTAFSLIKGAVVDRGGILSHAAIVSRQFGIPCAINTFIGTSKIKTGQRIRMDGTTGAVYILD